ncbi:hypothetical protein HanPSC8_Chr02g0055661 [Helianthus annuus]|nr:hypothetical protein HanPSC8_Chr02g0055661 [Helianthus annuus]
MLYFKFKRFKFKICSQSRLCVEETLNVKFNELSSLKIPANPAELFDLDKFTFEDVSVKINPAGTQQPPLQDYGYDVVIAQYKITSTTRAADVQNSYQSSSTAASIVVNQSSSSTTTLLSLTTVDKNQSTVDKNKLCATPIPPIPPPFKTNVGSSTSPTDISSDDSHLQPSLLNAIVPYKGDLTFLKSHPPNQVIGNINEGVLTRSQPKTFVFLLAFYHSINKSSTKRL